MYEKIGILFIGSALTVIVYSVNKKFDNWRLKKRTLKNLKHELEFNIKLLEDYASGTDSYIAIMKTNITIMPVLFRYRLSDYQTHFFNISLQNGYLYKELKYEELSEIIRLNSNMNEEREKGLNNNYMDALQQKVDSEDLFIYYSNMESIFLKHKEYLTQIKEKI